MIITSRTAELLRLFFQTSAAIVSGTRTAVNPYHSSLQLFYRVSRIWQCRHFDRTCKGTGCFCKTMRIATDSDDRPFVPDVSTFSVYVLDTAGNVLTHFGEYGNTDTCRSNLPASLPPQPEIAFAWPLSVACGGEMAFVSDQVNCRLVGMKFELCDLSSDIAEENQVSGAHPKVTREMKRLMASARTVPQGNGEILVVTPPRKKMGRRSKRATASACWWTVGKWFRPKRAGPIRGESFGLYLWNSGRIDNVKVTQIPGTE